MVRIECNHRQQRWPTVMWKLQLVLNITKHRTTQQSALNLLIGIDAATPLIRSLVRDVAIEGSSPNREALREMRRQRASERLRSNREAQDTYVNQGRKAPRVFEINSLVFVRKQAQSTGKLDSCMRGPYRVVKALSHGRYELQLLAGSYGKTTQAAAEYMIPWRGEWTPDVCADFFLESDVDNEESTVPSVDVQPSEVETPDVAIEPQPSTSGTQGRIEELPVPFNASLGDEGPGTSLPTLETDLQS